VTRALVTLFAGAALLAAQRPHQKKQSTDERIAAIELRFKQSPGDAAVRDELTGGFLQKMRESADGSYLERAERLVDATLKSDPVNYAARGRRVEIAMQRHRFQEVIALAGTLAKERPEDSTVWGLLGDAFMERGEYDSAADAYQKMSDLRPSLASYNRVSFYRFVTGDAEGAIAIMRQAIRMGSPEPENVAWCLADLGNMLLKSGAGGEAERAYRDSLTSFPGYHHALFGLARVLAARQQFDGAIDTALQAQAKAPFPEYAGLLAQLYRKIGKPDLANRQLALLDITDKLDRAAGESANRSLALAFSDLDYRTDRALELARAELTVRRDVYTYDALAWALFKNGRHAEAVEAIGKALSQNTPEPSFREHAARILKPKIP